MGRYVPHAALRFEFTVLRLRQQRRVLTMAMRSATPRATAPTMSQVVGGFHEEWEFEFDEDVGDAAERTWLPVVSTPCRRVWTKSL